MVRTLPQGSWLSGTPKLQAPWLMAFFFPQGPWFIGFPYFVGSPKLPPWLLQFPVQTTLRDPSKTLACRSLPHP